MQNVPSILLLCFLGAHMECWICGAQASSGEHLTKASDLRMIFGNAIIISRCLDALIRLVLTPVGRSKILKNPK